MKKGWKIFGIVCASLAGIGLLLCVTAVILGFSWNKFVEENPDGIGFVKKKTEMLTGYADSDIWADDGMEESSDILSGDFDMTFADIDSISIELAAGEMEIRTYDGKDVKLAGENVSKKLQVRCESDGTTLKFRTGSKLWKRMNAHSEHAGKLFLYLPANRVIQKADMKVGAGNMTVESMEAGEMKLDVGVGEARLKDIISGTSDISCGVGSVTLKGTLTGDTSVEVGIGEVEMELAGRKEDFNYKISGGIGSIRVDGHSYDGAGKTIEENHGADAGLEITGGIGDIDIEFAHNGKHK